jgi:hypothetical protein
MLTKWKECVKHIDLLGLVFDVKALVQRFCKEVLIWKALSHPNILPFLGVVTSPFPFGMISPWMIQGNIIKYSKLHQKNYDIIWDLVSVLTIAEDKT